LDFAHIIINADHIMADIGETSTGHKANIARTDDRKVHKERKRNDSVAALLKG